MFDACTAAEGVVSSDQIDASEILAWMLCHENTFKTMSKDDAECIWTDYLFVSVCVCV